MQTAEPPFGALFVFLRDEIGDARFFRDVREGGDLWLCRSSVAANAAGLALVLSRRWRRLAPAFWLLAGLVAFSRVYLNRHFLSDALCGVVIGVVLGGLVLDWLRARGWSWEAKP